MQKMSTERSLLQGKTMGTLWSVQIDGTPPPALHAALQAAVEEIDQQMSNWSETSDLMRFNAADVGVWHPLPAHLLCVLTEGLSISRATGGAFEMNVGAAVRAWGFNAAPINLDALQAASAAPHIQASVALELDLAAGRARKTADLWLDLAGIAKGYGVDRLAEVVQSFGIDHALCAIDGELRALGTQANGTPWPVAIERPDSPDRAAQSIIALDAGAVASSGDYRHFLTIKGKRLSHTMDPQRAAPLLDGPASVSVLAPRCLQADAMATALMVMGEADGLAFAKATGISALFLMREAAGLRASGTGVFAA